MLSAGGFRWSLRIAQASKHCWIGHRLGESVTGFSNAESITFDNQFKVAKQLQLSLSSGQPAYPVVLQFYVETRKRSSCGPLDHACSHSKQTGNFAGVSLQALPVAARGWRPWETRCYMVSPTHYIPSSHTPFTHFAPRP